MGSCCSGASPTPVSRGLEASGGTASSSSVVDPTAYHPAVSVVPGVGVGVAGEEPLHGNGLAPLDAVAELPYTTTPEPQQLEHIADREGKDEEMVRVQSCVCRRGMAEVALPPSPSPQTKSHM